MKKEVEEIKDYQIKQTFSEAARHFHGIFKTIGVESFIKKYEEEGKTKTKKNELKKLSVSEYLDQLCKEKNLNNYKKSIKLNNGNSISAVNKFISNKNNNNIDIFSEDYIPPFYIKPNLIRVKEKNEKQKEKSNFLIEKMKKKLKLPPLGKYNIKENIIRKHIPAICFSNTNFRKNSSSNSSCEKVIKEKINKYYNKHIKINSLNNEERNKPNNIINYFWKENIKFTPLKNQMKKNKSEMNINETNSIQKNLFSTHLKIKASRNKKKRNIILNSYSNNNDNKNISFDVFIKKIRLIDKKKEKINKPHKFNKKYFISNILNFS